MKNCILRISAVFAGTLFLCTGSAWARATLTPATIESGTEQIFTLAVKNESDDAKIQYVEMRVPAGFNVGGFAPNPGWVRIFDTAKHGDGADIRKVIWSHPKGAIEPGEVASFQFVGGSGIYSTWNFRVIQTYTDGSVTDWRSASETSKFPAAHITTLKSFKNSNGVFTWNSIVIATLALLLVVHVVTTRSKPKQPTS